MSTKTKAKKPKTEKWGYIQLRSFYTINKTIDKVKRQLTE